jgi:hypothetical protein
MQQQFATLLPCGSALGPDVAVSAAAAREGIWARVTTLEVRHAVRSVFVWITGAVPS